MSFVKRLWDWAGDIYLTLWIIVLMVLDLTWGFFILKHHNDLFEPINDRGFMEWAATWGRESLGLSAWLFVLVALLALLSINTFVCTTQRVVVLVRFRHRFKNFWRFVLKFGPHIMHYSMLIMFTGYLFSYLGGGTHLGKVLLQEKSIQVDQTKITLTDLAIEYYSGKRMPHLENRAIHVRGVLEFQKEGETKTADISFNHPAVFKGMSVHLKKFGPRSKVSAMGTKRRYVTVTVKKDPGIGFYFVGMAFFVLGLFMYTWEKIIVKKPVQTMADTNVEEK